MVLAARPTLAEVPLADLSFTPEKIRLLLHELRCGLLHGHLQAAVARHGFACCHILLGEDGQGDLAGFGTLVVNLVDPSIFRLKPVGIAAATLLEQEAARHDTPSSDRQAVRCVRLGIGVSLSSAPCLTIRMRPDAKRHVMIRATVDGTGFNRLKP